jgi:hypothetical protein
MYIFLTIIVLIFLIILIPIKVVIDYEFYSKDYNINNENIKKEIKIYILRFIKIITFKKKKKEKSNNENNDNNIIYNLINVYKKYKDVTEDETLLDKLKKSMKIQKIDLEVGFNSKNYIVNSYIMAYINYYINMNVAKNIDRFNLNKTKYNTYISDKLLKVKIKGILDLKIVNTIHIIIKLIFKYMKGGKNNGKETSNRGFNVNSYDFS